VKVFISVDTLRDLILLIFMTDMSQMYIEKSALELQMSVSSGILRNEVCFI
jgi:hypothetical protein